MARFFHRRGAQRLMPQVPLAGALSRAARLALVGALAVTGLAFAASAGRAEGFPDKPIRMIVPYPPGSGTDIVGRLLAQKLGETLGQTVIVDNRPGAGGTIGTSQAAKADPDGYTILMADLGPLAVAPSIYKKLSYDPLKDLTPIGEVAVLPFILVVNKDLPVKTVPELIALAKSKPGELNYASVGNGTAVHLATELFKQKAGIDVLHVPYKGSAPALTDLVAGRTNFMFVNVLSARPFLETGQLRVLAIGTPKRSPAMPDVPTVEEFSMAGYRAMVWFGLLAPAGTPAPIVAKLSEATQKALGADDFQKQLAQQGAIPAPSSAQEFGDYIKAETAKWADVIHTSGISME